MSVTIHIIWTVLAFAIFVGVVIWAYSSGRKADFEKASRMAMDDDKPINSEKNQE